MNQKREWDIISMPCFLFFRIKGTVIVRIWWQLVLVALYTAVVVWIHLYQLKMEFDMSLIPILGAVIGLLLVFRTNTAYDRWTFLLIGLLDPSNLLMLIHRSPLTGIGKAENSGQK